MDRVKPYVLQQRQDAVALPGSGRPTLFWHATHAGHWHTGAEFFCRRQHHPGHQLMFILGGQGYCEYRGRRRSAGPGTCVVMDLSVPHLYASDPDDPWAIFWVILDSRGPGLDAQVRALTGSSGAVVPFGSIRQVLTMAEALFPLIRRSQPDDDAWIHHHLTGLMALLFEAQQHRLLDPSLDDRPVANRRLGVAAALDLIRDQYARTLALDELAAAAGYTASHFVRRFRTATGTTPFDYLERYRIARAQELLHRGSVVSIATAGATVGYEDPAYFSRVFKRVTGTTPRRYREHA